MYLLPNLLFDQDGRFIFNDLFSTIRTAVAIVKNITFYPALTVDFDILFICIPLNDMIRI